MVDAVPENIDAVLGGDEPRHVVNGVVNETASGAASR